MAAIWANAGSPGDAVTAVGGPEADARKYADAGPDRDKQFLEAFEGETPPKAKGKHAARVHMRAEREPGLF